ncbi:MAG: hypothetical protein MUP27_08920 [Desulfobacterales bacterium]|nr:hypothetical protein [Desulfobacterales bacterium]
MIDLKSLRHTLEQKKGERQIIERQVVESEKRVQGLGRDISFSEQAQVIIQAVARQTQKQLEYRVGELVSLAQASVFDDPWILKLVFVPRRGKTECDLGWQKSDGRESSDIRYGGGGGESDVASLGLQFAVWSLQRPKTRSVMFLDEPLKWLKGGDLPERGALMIKEISKGLALQILMISHIPDQIEGADKVFEFVQKGGITQIERKR